LAWACAVASAEVLDISSIYRHRGGATHSTPTDLDVWERHAQAGAILGMAERTLSESELTYLAARWGRVPRARAALCRSALKNIGRGTQKAAETAFKRHCGARLGLHVLAMQLAGSGTAAFQTRFNRQMDPLYRGVIGKLEPVLLGHGLMV